jgi:surface antigen
MLKYAKALIVFGLVFACLPAAAHAGCKRGGDRSGVGRVGTSILHSFSRKLGLDTEVGSAVTSMLSTAFLCALNPEQQQKATAATTTALNSTKSDVPAEWTSTSDPNVSGSSTAAKPTKLADGSQCRVVTQVGYVDGKEITDSPTYCRAPGSNAWTLKA